MTGEGSWRDDGVRERERECVFFGGEKWKEIIYIHSPWEVKREGGAWGRDCTVCGEVRERSPTPS